MSSSSRLSASTAAVMGLAVVLLLTSGCSYMPNMPNVGNRRWDGCAIGGGVAGLIIGGTAGAVIYQENGGNHPRSSDRALWAGASALGAGLLGAVAGHYICDPVIEAAPPPPPPPPPVAEAPPPPPP